MGTIAFPIFIALLLPVYLAAQAPEFIREPGGIRVIEGGKDVLFYRTQPLSIDGQFERSNYIHPLYGMEGEVLTEDFPEDHLHHRGIFWAWHQVRIGDQKVGDAWECRDFIWELQAVDLQASDSLPSLNSHLVWKSPSYTDRTGRSVPFMEEKLRISIHPGEAGYRVMDFEIALRALVPGLLLGGSEDEKGYGGFSVRLKLPPDVHFLSEAGAIEPSETAVRAGNWMDISGSMGLNGGRAGIVIISCNAFGQDGTPWILREKASMQNAVFPGRDPIPIPQENPLVLRYRLLVYKGKLSPEEIDSLQACCTK